MKTLIFLCGTGVGSLLEFLITIVIIGRTTSASEATRKFNEDHSKELLASLKERNRLLEKQNIIMAGARRSGHA